MTLKIGLNGFSVYIQRELIQCTQVKSFSKTLLAAYLLFLLWLILFKTSTDFSSVVSNYQSRSLNLVPFAGYSSSKHEMFDNLIAFIPLGLLLGVNFKQMSLQRKLAFVTLFSFTAEVVQFILAIGRTDITDVIMNSLGGLLGLVLYGMCGKRGSRILDWAIMTALTVLLMLFLALRFFVLRVRY